MCARNSLYDCLVIILDYKMPTFIGSPEKFKHKLDLKDDITVEDLDKLSDALEKYTIRVSGDMVYEKVVDSVLEINMKYVDKVFSIKYKRTSYNAFNAKEKKVMIVDRIDGHIIGYDGKSQFDVSQIEYAQAYKHFPDHILIPCDSALTMEESYKAFRKNAKELKAKTGNIINLFKSGSIVNTTLSLFDRYMKICYPDKITRVEVELLEKATHSALMHAVPYEGECWEYDVNSFFGSILKSSHFLIPVREGELMTIDTLEKMPCGLGIYRCKIAGPDNAFEFKTNNDKTYTSIEVSYALKQGYEVTLIQDGKPNLLFYARNKCVTGSQIFKRFIEYMYALKEDDVVHAKDIITHIWGALTEVKKKYRHTKDGHYSETDTIKTLSTQLLEIGGDHLITYADIEDYYVHDWARLKPFLLATARVSMYKFIGKNAESVKRVHTDSIYSSIPLSLSLSRTIGEFKLTKWKSIKIVNMRKPIGIEEITSDSS